MIDLRKPRRQPPNPLISRLTLAKLTLLLLIPLIFLYLQTKTPKPFERNAAANNHRIQTTTKNEHLTAEQFSPLPHQFQSSKFPNHRRRPKLGHADTHAIVFAKKEEKSYSGAAAGFFGGFWPSSENDQDLISDDENLANENKQLFFEQSKNLQISKIDEKRLDLVKTKITKIFVGAEKYPWCPFFNEHYSRFAPLQLDQSKKFFIALNLFNSERIIPNLLVQLVTLIEFIGNKRIYLSIYENGSTDKTKQGLLLIKHTMDSMGVDNNIVSGDAEAVDWKKVHRLEMLAKLRNLAMKPLFEMESGKFDNVVFINDVFFCASDVLELILNQFGQAADITCGLDYVWTKRMNDHIFYDNWVSRDMNGTRFWSNVFRWKYEMLSNDTIGRSKWEAGNPFQVWSCWNGLVVMNATPFYQGVRFRRSVISKNECSASECSLVVKDFWEKDFGRVMIVPSVKVVYWVEAHEKVHRDYPPFAQKNPYFNEIGNQNNDKSWVQAFWSKTREESMIRWREGPKTVVCLPIEGLGTHLADEKHPVWEEVPNRRSPLRLH